MPVANHETQRFLRGVFADVRDLVLFVINLLHVHAVPSIAHFVHDFIILFNPRMVRSFVLAQFGHVAMYETIVIGVVHDFRLTNELQRRLEAVPGVRWIFP